MNYGHEVVCCLNFEIDIKQLDVAFVWINLSNDIEMNILKKYGLSELQVYKYGPWLLYFDQVVKKNK